MTRINTKPCAGFEAVTSVFKRPEATQPIRSIYSTTMLQQWLL